MAANADKKDNIKFLASMFHMEQSVCEQVLQENKDNVEDAVNHILTMLNEAKPQENSENNELNDQVKQFEKEKLQEKEKKEKLLRQQQEAMRKYEEERAREKLEKEAYAALMLKEKQIAEQKKKELEDLAREEELLALELEQGNYICYIITFQYFARINLHKLKFTRKDYVRSEIWLDSIS